MLSFEFWVEEPAITPDYSGYGSAFAETRTFEGRSFDSTTLRSRCQRWKLDSRSPIGVGDKLRGNDPPSHFVLWRARNPRITPDYSGYGSAFAETRTFEGRPPTTTPAYHVQGQAFEGKIAGINILEIASLRSA